MTKKIKGYCSYCGEHSIHRQEQANLVRRNIYTCDCCGRRTVQCRLCDEFAKGGEFWDDELCSLHDKSHTSFEKPNPNEAFKLSQDDSNAPPFEWGEISLKQLASGTKTPIIVIDGFLSENDTNEQDWKTQLNQTHPNHPIYQANWKSQEAKDLYRLFQKAIELDIIRSPQLGLIISGLSVFNGYSLWMKAKIKAESAGLHLANLLKHQNNQQGFILMGHSLGVRVIYHALGQLERLKHTDKINEVHLLGGALGITHSWKKAAKSVQGNIHNYYSKNDDTLKYLYEIIEITGGKAIGRNEISGKNIISHNVTVKVNGHREYIKNIDKMYQLS